MDASRVSTVGAALRGRPFVAKMIAECIDTEGGRPRSAAPTVSFPRLLYVGDVPVEASYHGSALLYRLLAEYPQERLTVIETAGLSAQARRLPNVNYISYPIAKQRWLNTRFHPYAVAWFSQAGARLAPKISQSVNGFDFEGVLTVAHGFGWLAAAEIARSRNVPLHLMVHDDWPRAADIAPRFRKWLDGQFARVYRQAQSRLCVSPAMSRAYLSATANLRKLYIQRELLIALPSKRHPNTSRRNDKPFTIAFAGTINSNGYIRALTALQDALKPLGGRLLIFGPLTSDAARQVGLDNLNTEVRGLLSAADLLVRLREEADALFVPMSFDVSECDNMALAFPSKLADCTATGLPLLIYGPGYCSAVVWARENPGVAEVVESEADLVNVVASLANDPALCVALGKRALEVGREYFTHDRVQQVFRRALCEQS